MWSTCGRVKVDTRLTPLQKQRDLLEGYSSRVTTAIATEGLVPASVETLSKFLSFYESSLAEIDSRLLRLNREITGMGHLSLFERFISSTHYVQISRKSAMLCLAHSSHRYASKYSRRCRVSNSENSPSVVGPRGECGVARGDDHSARARRGSGCTAALVHHNGRRVDLQVRITFYFRLSSNNT